MCPTGSEGTSYALLTTMSNVAYAVAYAIGDMLTGKASPFKGKIELLGLFDGDPGSC